MRWSSAFTVCVRKYSLAIATNVNDCIARRALLTRLRNRGQYSQHMSLQSMLASHCRPCAARAQYDSIATCHVVCTSVAQNRPRGRLRSRSGSRTTISPRAREIE
jgi:hypothetical protein